MTELIDVLEAQYIARLAQRCEKWQIANPEQAKTIREDIAQKLRTVGRPDPEPGSLRWQVFEAAVNEAIRERNKWPTPRQWILQQNPPSPIAQRRVVPPAVTTPDHKAKASGERE